MFCRTHIILMVCFIHYLRVIPQASALFPPSNPFTAFPPWVEPRFGAFGFQSPAKSYRDGATWLFQELLARTNFGYISKRPPLTSAALSNSQRFCSLFCFFFPGSTEIPQGSKIA